MHPVHIASCVAPPRALVLFPPQSSPPGAPSPAAPSLRPPVDATLPTRYSASRRLSDKGLADGILTELIELLLQGEMLRLLVKFLAVGGVTGVTEMVGALRGPARGTTDDRCCRN